MFVSSLNDKKTFSMSVRDANNTSDNGWRQVWGKEAAAINPLAAVNQGRNNLILDAIKTNDWSTYNNFQAKQHPAWYNKVNGEFKQNKMYYSNLIDVQNRSLNEAIQSGDDKEIAKRKAHLDELVQDFKNAPGEMPHVVAFITNPTLAAEHGIGKPSNDWFNSPYNNPLVASQGRFSEQNWYDNPYFVDNPDEMMFAVEAVQVLRPDIAKIAASINKGAYERNVASTSYSSRLGQNVVDETKKDLVDKIVEQNDNHETNTANLAIVNQASGIIEQFGSVTLAEKLFKQQEKVQVTSANSFLLDQLARNAEQRRYEVV